VGTTDAKRCRAEEASRCLNAEVAFLIRSRHVPRHSALTKIPSRVMHVQRPRGFQPQLPSLATLATQQRYYCSIYWRDHFHIKMLEMRRCLYSVNHVAGFACMIHVKNRGQLQTGPTLSSCKTRNAPPPAASVIIARYFGLTEQNVASHELFVIRILS